MLLVNERAEGFYARSEALGSLAARTFLEEIHYSGHGALTSNEVKTLQRHRAQLTGLENIAETTLKASDVLDYIKKQIARPDRKGWREEYQGQRFGENLKRMIEQDLWADVDAICATMHNGNASDEEKRERQYIRLQLIRQLIRQLVVQYEYSVSQIEEEPRHDQRAGTRTNTPSQR